MKRLARFLARLYPSTWRKRYGAEFDELLEDTKPTTRDAVDVLKGALKMQVTTGTFMKTLLAFAMAGALAALAISFAFPKNYRSQAAIVITPRDDAASGQLAWKKNQVMWDVIENLKQHVVSRAELTRIIQSQNLYPSERSRKPMEEVVEHMSRNIVVRPVTHPNAGNQEITSFSIEFNYPDGPKAQRVTRDLMIRFIDDNVRDNANLEFLSHSELRSKVRLQPLDTASLPLKPTTPNQWTIATVGLFIGLMAGLAWAFIRRGQQGSAP
jgi:uncharacterized protein involved in exopolysaccharide biosynthesis